MEPGKLHNLIRKKCPGSSYCLTHNVDPTSTEDCRITLEKYMYDSLVGMAKLGTNLYHEAVPIRWNAEKERLESLYEDIWYKY